MMVLFKHSMHIDLRTIFWILMSIDMYYKVKRMNVRFDVPADMAFIGSVYHEHQNGVHEDEEIAKIQIPTLDPKEIL